MELRPLFLMAIGIALPVSFIASAVLLSTAIDLTIKNGFVIHDEYIGWAIFSTLVTIVLWVYGKRVDPGKEEDE